MGEDVLSSIFGGGASSLISGIFGLLGQRSANHANADLARYQNEWNLQMYERQKKDAIEQWNRENEYNSPQETMARLTAAGINPRTINGSSSQYANAGNATMPQAPSAVSYRYESPLSKFQDIGNIMKNILELDFLKAQTEKTRSEASRNDAQSELFNTQSLLTAMQDLQGRDKHELWKFLNAYQVDKVGRPVFGNKDQQKSVYGSALSNYINDVRYRRYQADYQYYLSNQLEEDTAAGVQGINGLYDGVIKLGGRVINRIFD